MGCFELVNDSLTPVQIGITAGVYATFARYNCFRIGRLIWFSCVVTTNIALTSANDIASGLPATSILVDAIATASGGNSYAIFINGDRLKPNGSLPAGTYMINFMYIANS